MPKTDEYGKATRGGKPVPSRNPGPLPETPVPSRPPVPDKPERPADPREPDRTPGPPRRPDSPTGPESDPPCPTNWGIFILASLIFATVLYLALFPVKFTIPGVDLSPVLTALSTIHEDLKKIPTDRPLTALPVCPDVREPKCPQCPRCPDCPPPTQCGDKKCPPAPPATICEPYPAVLVQSLQAQVRDLQGKNRWLRKLLRDEKRKRPRLRPQAKQGCLEPRESLERHYQWRTQVFKHWLSKACSDKKAHTLRFETNINETVED